jgi:ankyrin repeat protein
MVTVNLQGTEVSCTALGAAVWNGDQQRVKEFLDAGADINAPLAVRIPGTPEYSTYAICMAVEAVAMQKAQRDLVEFLLNNGADVNVSYQRHYALPSGVGPVSTETPLALAISADRADIVALLREHGADQMRP